MNFGLFVDRFGFVSNELVRDHAIRGWNSLTNKSIHAFQHYCKAEKNFADCFEKFEIRESGVKREIGLQGFFEVYGNYYELKLSNDTIISKYEATENCGLSEGRPNIEQANGIICH